MSTTSKYNFIFLLPISITDLPLPFDQFEIPETEPKEYYSYNEYMVLPGNKAFYTSSGSHAIFETNVTSVFALPQKLSQFLADEAANIVLKEGIDMEAWTDEVQTDYLWIIPTEPNLAYNYDEFCKVTLL
jgi:hypothetical protein